MRPPPAALSWPWLVLPWLVLVGAALWVRPLTPVDETRYVSVAWEMWLRGDFLVPYLNGEPYPHKPPLLFWVMHLGWSVFGVSEWWPRLIAPLIALVNLVLVRRVALRLWPDRPMLADRAAWMLFGVPFWALFQTLVQFDLLLVLFTLTGVLGLLAAAAGRAGGWLILGLALGLGILSKGPVILLHLLPVALLGPVWLRDGPGLPAWYGGILAAVVLGAVVALAWAVPAGLAGGAAYRDAIFWGQTAGRMVESFAHREPAWWYLPWLPVLSLPWVLWGRFWRGLRRRAGWQGDAGLRLLWCWMLPVLVALSLISGKQVKYLLPLLPAAMLVLARLAAAGQTTPRRPLLAALMLIGGGLLVAGLPGIIPAERNFWAPSIPAWPGVGLILIGILALMLPPLSPERQIQTATLATVMLVLALHLGVVRTAAPAYDLKDLARKIHAVQEDGHAVGHYGTYHGQYQFLGRLERPVEEIFPSGPRLRAWLRAHPDGFVIVQYSHYPFGVPADGRPIHEQAYRGDPADLAMWPAGALRAALPPGQ